MPTALCAGNSLPLENGRIASPLANGFGGGHIAAARANAELSISQPKLLRLEALNRSFHNAANLATELRESLTNAANGTVSPTTAFNGSTPKCTKGAPTTSHSSLVTTNSNGTQKSAVSAYPAPTNTSPSAASAIVRHFSLRIKNHVQTSLSDPLKRRGSSRRRDLSAKNIAESAANINDENGPAMDSSSDEDDVELKLQIEREEIVERYDRGPDDEENIRRADEAWENPNFEMYQKTDRYGFIHEKELRAAQEKRAREKERERCLKWDKMFHEWEHRTPEKLARRIWKGVPDSYRLKIWGRLLNVDKLIAQNGANTYNELLERARLLSTDVRQIDVDVLRTYRDHVMFMRRYDASQQSLFNILIAYSMYNTEIGYCQGMNHLAAILLMYLGDEESAFWGLHSMLTDRKYLMHGFFVPGFPKFARFSEHFDRVLKRYLPSLYKHMQKEDICQPYLTRWWFGIYLDRVPFSLAMRIWDVFIHIGDSVLIAMAYNIMKMHAKPLSKLSMDSFMDYVQNKIAVNFGYDDDRVMKSLRQCLEKLQDDRMALPPQPKKGESMDLPLKDFGPVLRRSLMDIRNDISEIHSRSSRTNSKIDLSSRSEVPFIDQESPIDEEEDEFTTSLNTTVTSDYNNEVSFLRRSSIPVAGRSPAMKSRRVINPQTPSHRVQSPHRHQTDSPNGQRSRSAAPPPPQPTSSIDSGSSSNGKMPPMDPFHRKPSLRNGRAAAPPPIPDADGFIPLASSTRNRHSFYDNVTPSTTPSAGSTAARTPISHSREMSGQSAVHRTANNVTYVAVGEDAPPASPTPDYDEEEEAEEEDRQMGPSIAKVYPTPLSYAPAGARYNHR